MARGMRRVPTYYNDLVEVIGANPGHVIGSTACLGGALATQLLKYENSHSEELLQKIFSWITQMDNLFGHGNFFFEMQPSHSREQSYVNKMILQLTDTFEIPYIITTDSHYLKKSDAEIHAAFLNAQDGDREVSSFYATTYMMSDAELREYFKKDLTEAEIEYAYDNIHKIYESCEDYSLLKPLKIPELPWKTAYNIINYNKYYELMPWLDKFSKSDYDGDRLLAKLIAEAVAKDENCQNEETYSEIDNCLKITWESSEKNKAHWSAYFLNLQRIIDECWNAGTLVGPGRGSGVGFILLYLLEITQINPLRETTRTFAWRFLNPERVSVLDVDVDIEGGRRGQVLQHLRNVYGSDRVSNVATFGTEKSKSAILTAARGLGIDVDVAQYISSLIPADRGLTRTLDQCMFGDEENDYPPIKQFVYEMTENYPELWKVAHKIEGLVNRMGSHAGGVIFVDEPFTESTALMRTPDNTIITQFDLHDCEDCSLIKYDLLSVEALDRIHTTLDLLVEYKYVDAGKTLKETYENTIGVYNLERTSMDMWKMIWRHDIQALFQMEKASGIQGIALTHPESVDDLATLNSVIRLMAQEKGGEQPLNKYARFKKDIGLWYQEMDRYGLTPYEQELLEPIVKISYGICESQERFMQLVQLPECGGYDLNWADKLRKSIAKKNPAAFLELEHEFFENAKEKNLSLNFCNYVWKVLVSTSKGYGFNLSHTLAYSLVALQEMNLAYRYPIIFWNCACLITDSGGGEQNEEMIEELDEQVFEEFTESCIEEFVESEPEEELVDIYECEDQDEYEYEDLPDRSAKKKKKRNKTTNYGKIASAIGKMKMAGIEVSAPDINHSTFTFSPDVENNAIRYGMSGISKVGEDLIKRIMEKRPYVSWSDFVDKIAPTKPQMINLIKSGAFDSFGDRNTIMMEYIDSVSDKKKRVTLQNMKMLIDFKLIPEEYEFQCRVYNFNKYLKKFKVDNDYILDENAIRFYSENFDMDLIFERDGALVINQDKWEKIYKKQMDIIRPFVKNNSDALLEQINSRLVNDTWSKYCEGSLSKWEMDSVSFYSHDHELAKAKLRWYDVEDFFKLPEDPPIDQILNFKGKQVPLFRLTRIAGTVLDKDKSKKTVTLLTTTGVVTVKIFGPVFSNYDKQISELGADGKKHVIEKSWFARGNKLIVTGIRRGDDFAAKKYTRTPWHLVELIKGVNEEGGLIIQHERYNEETE